MEELKVENKILSEEEKIVVQKELDSKEFIKMVKEVNKEKWTEWIESKFVGVTTWEEKRTSKYTLEKISNEEWNFQCETEKYRLKFDSRGYYGISEKTSEEITLSYNFISYDPKFLTTTHFLKTGEVTSDFGQKAFMKDGILHQYSAPTIIGHLTNETEKYVMYTETIFQDGNPDYPIVTKWDKFKGLNTSCCPDTESFKLYTHDAWISVLTW